MAGRLRLSIGVGAVGALLAGSVAAVASPVGVERQISGVGAAPSAYSPAVAYNPVAEEFLVVWHYSGDVQAIYGRRVGADGRPVGDAYRISGADSVISWGSKSVAYNTATNQYLVVWEDSRYSIWGGDVFGRRVGADGRPVGGESRISAVGATSGASSPEVAYSAAANQFLVVWEDRRDFDTRGMDVYGRRVGANGRPVGDERRISGRGAVASDFSPAVAYSAATEQFLVVWEDQRNEDTRGSDTYGRLVGADGRPVGGESRISSRKATGDERSPSVAYGAAASQFLVVWSDYRNEDTRGSDTYGRRVGADGRPAGGESRISSRKATDDESSLAVAYNSVAEEFLVVWEDHRDEAARGTDVYGRPVATDGRPSAGEFRISGWNAVGYEWVPAVAYQRTHSQYLVVWEDARQFSTGESDVYGRRVAG